MEATDLIILRHESIHCVAALALGGALDYVARDRHRGFTRSLWSEAVADPVRDGIITLTPFLDCAVGCEEDLQYVRGLCDAGTSLSAIWDGASKLLADPAFRHKVRVVEAALMQHVALTGIEVELLLAMTEEERL